MFYRSLLLVMFVYAGCSFESSATTEEVSHEKERKSFAIEVSFEKNSAELTQTARTKLSALYEEVRALGKLEKVKVITWGDVDYPAIYSKKTALSEVDLVVERNKSLLIFLDELTPKTNVQFSNMAERSASISHYFADENESTRKSLEAAGIPNTDTIVKVPGKASKSIVIFIMEE